MSHGKIERGSTLTVVVGMEPGSVRNAEPNLQWLSSGRPPLLRCVSNRPRPAC